MSIMTAPFTSDPALLQPKRLRSEPFGGVDNVPYVAGCGYAAHQAYTMSVVRLSDGTQWLLGDDTVKVQTPIGITCDEIFAFGWNNGVAALYRIPLDALGPGTPPD